MPSEAAGQAIVTRLTAAGLPAAYMPGRDIDLEKPVVKVLTLQSAKGLEFPVVVVAGFVGGGAYGVTRDADADETEEALQRRCRTMFVTMTRAMRGLLVISPEVPSPLFEGLDPPLWNV